MCLYIKNIGKVSFENAHVQELLGYIYLISGKKKEGQKYLKEAVSVYSKIWVDEMELLEDKINYIKLFYTNQISKNEV